MKIVKKLLGFASLLLIPSIMTNAATEYGVKVGMENVIAEEGTVSVYISQNQGEIYDLANTDIKVLLNNQELEIMEKDYIKNRTESVSYYCMVDVSGSMDEKRINTVKDIMGQMVDQKGKQDNFCISTIGNTLNNGGLSADSAAIHGMIDNITVTQDDTNLYYGITEMIKAMQKDEGVHTLRYFIIFSDGAEDQAKGITREEATSEIEHSHIPVYTVAMLKENSSDAELESAKILGSFARKSIGGMHFTPTLDHYDYQEISAYIKEISNAGILINANLGQPELSGKDVSFKVTGLTNTDTKIEMNVEKSIIQQAIIVPEPIEEIVSEEPKPVEPVDNTMVYLYIGIAVAAILVIIIVFIILMRKKSNNQQYTETVYGEPQSEEPRVKDVWKTDNTNGFDSTPLSKSASLKKKHTLHLVRMGIQESAEYEIPLEEEYIIGRKKGKCDLVITDDMALSNEHCKLTNKGGSIYMEDMTSSNGTFVNGVPITGAFALNIDDTIMIGSYEYRIYW